MNDNPKGIGVAPIVDATVEAVKSLRPRSAMRAFLHSEAAGGIVLMIAAAAAMIVANTPLAATYFQTLSFHLGPLSILH
ncbi:MAG: hypothetical protein EOO77_19855, partial [Oxalobacteraceae bacterium]